MRADHRVNHPPKYPITAERGKHFGASYAARITYVPSRSESWPQALKAYF